jgi:ATP-dependent Clp protease ATP-binding subunit ClpX
VNVPPQGGRKHPDQKMISINTQNILFICGGAFDGINRIIESRLNTTPLGFTSNIESKERHEVGDETILRFINAQDLKRYGLIPELIGRLPVLTYLNPLDRETLKLILTEPKNALTKQYSKLFEMEGVKIEFKKSALEYIVDKAVEFKLGARGLRSICEAIMNDAMFEMPSDKDIKELIITKAYAVEKFEKSRINKLKVA